MAFGRKAEQIAVSYVAFGRKAEQIAVSYVAFGRKAGQILKLVTWHLGGKLNK